MVNVDFDFYDTNPEVDECVFQSFHVYIQRVEKLPKKIDT